MDLMLATSKAGHDKGKTYVIINEENDSYVLANGTTKPLDKTKKKKKIHVQVIKELPNEVKEISAELKELSNESIINILKSFSRRSHSERSSEL